MTTKPDINRFHPTRVSRTAYFCLFFVMLVRPIAIAATTGGLSGKVLRVTTLAADGPGSLRAAVEATGPRLIVFEVGGVIDLRGQTFVLREPHVTIAGQTAPDPGITLIRGGLIVETHDVIIQHLAVRPGDGKGMTSSTGDRTSTGNWAPDALGVRRSSARPAHDVVFEHCSATWAVDENLSASGPADISATDGPDATAHDITLRHCLIAEALSRATHPKGEHSKGTLVHDGARNVTIEGCLYAHNRERNPRLKGGTSTVVRESLMYNWGSACVGVGARGAKRILDPAEVVLAGNVAIAGPDTRGRYFIKSVDPGGRVAMCDNIVIGAEVADSGVVVLPVPQLSVMPPWDAAKRVLRSAGSRPARRDPIDARIVRSVIDGTGSIIDSQEEVGGYPVRKETRRALTVPANVDERRKWLERLSLELSEDAMVDVSALRKRVTENPRKPARREESQLRPEASALKPGGPISRFQPQRGFTVAPSPDSRR